MTIWNIKKTAEYLERSTGAIRNLVLRRKIPYRKICGRLVFIEDEIKSWIEKAPGVTLKDLQEGDR